MADQQVIIFDGDVIRSALQEQLNQTYFKHPMQITNFEQDSEKHQQKAYKITVQPLPKTERKATGKKARGLGDRPLQNGNSDALTVAIPDTRQQ